MSDFIDETYKRIEQIISYKSLNVRSFEDRIDVSNNSVGTAIRRKSSFKSNVLNKILHSFPEINPTWLLTGKGEMLLDNRSNLVGESLISYKIAGLDGKVKANLLKLLLEDSEVKKAISVQVEKILKS